MSAKNRLSRNMGRVELLAARSKIKVLLEAGYDRKKIHTSLSKEGEITMSYSTFCYQLNKLTLTEAAGVALGGSPPPKSPALRRADKSEPFSIDRNVSIKDLV